MDSVYYSELCPADFLKRLEKMPVAYLPLGTLEWHGPHLPLGADGIQAEGLFVQMAEKVGGIVLPPLFVGPDRIFKDGDTDYYGMDICTPGTLQVYPVQQHPGSAYWMDDELFKKMLWSILTQLKRAGFKAVIGHGHGPSTRSFISLKEEAENSLGLKLYTAWDFAKDEKLAFQNDHAAANETSAVMALRPELVEMDRIENEKDRIGMAGADPTEYASAEFGRQMIEHAIEGLKEYLGCQETDENC